MAKKVVPASIMKEISGFKYKPGSLDPKTSHLVGLAASVVAGCSK